MTEKPNKKEPREAESNATFEDSLRRLEAIVKEMERADLPLEAAFARFEEGTRIARLCQAKLQKVEERLTELLDNGETRPASIAVDDDT